MKRFIAGFCATLYLAGSVAAQTPTPIQTRKNNQPPSNNSITTTPSSSKKVEEMSYCANSMRVFRGIGTYYPEFKQYGIQFKYKLCFTDGNEVYNINRIFLYPYDPTDYSQYFWTSIVNQPIRVMMLKYLVIKFDGEYEVVARRFDIVKDD